MKTLASVTERRYDAMALRICITREIKRSKKSREQIAAEMSKSLNEKITARMITAFTADSKELHRWPGQYDIAFCEAVGNYRLLSERVKRAGFRMVGLNEERLIRIGKAWEQKTQAEKILAGVEL